MKATPIESTVDAFGTEIRAGSKVVYYTGDGACLKRGTVKRILDKSHTWYSHAYTNHRVMLEPDDRPGHTANVGHKLCMVEKPAPRSVSERCTGGSGCTCEKVGCWSER